MASTRQVSVPPVRRILETSLYVADLQRSERFYGLTFAFEVMLRDDRMCALAVPGRQVLLLFQRGATAKPTRMPFGIVPPHDGRGTQHVCFSIAHADLAAWEKHLAAAAIAVESRIDWPNGGSSLYFRDPDNHSVEVATSGLWDNDPLEEGER